MVRVHIYTGGLFLGDIPPRQRPPGQRPLRIETSHSMETPLDIDPQTETPWTETSQTETPFPWTETPLNRDSLDVYNHHRKSLKAACGQTDTCENIIWTLMESRRVYENPKVHLQILLWFLSKNVIVLNHNITSNHHNC